MYGCMHLAGIGQEEMFPLSSFIVHGEYTLEVEGTISSGPIFALSCVTV